MEYTVSPEEVKRVKGMGFLQDKRYPDVFNARVITRNGKLTAAQHRVIAEACERFGSGEVTMTVRLTLEIQGVKYENIQPLVDFLAEHGLSTGGTGKRVRPVVVALPHKFKIAVGGCPNNCVKPDLNDLGVIGQRIPTVYLEKCRGCKKCRVEAACPIKVAHLDGGKVVIDPAACNHCGRCRNQCPFGAVADYVSGYKVYIGGRWGKKVAQGRALSRIFTTEDEVMAVTEKAIELFRTQGIDGERFADTVARLGFENVERMLIS